MTGSLVADRRRCLLGESPRWDVATSELVWVDILAGDVLTKSWGGQPPRRVHVGGRVGAVVRRAGRGGYAVAQDRRVLLLDADLRVQDVLVGDVPGSGRGFRINECGVDPGGRLVLGTMTTDRKAQAAALWRWDDSGVLGLLVAGVTLSNGVGWDPTGRFMYYVDSPVGQLLRFDYGPDRATNPTVVADLRDRPGMPDGLTVDADGDVWLAMVNAGQVLRLSPAGMVVEVLDLPASKVTSCALGEIDGCAHLFVTSGAVGRTEDELVSADGEGFTYAVPVDATPAREHQLNA